jgi:hypothetical protein
VNRFTCGSALAGGGIALIGAGGAVAAAVGGGTMGFVLILLGGIALLVGFTLLAIGFRAHFGALVESQAAADSREAARDTLDQRRDARDEERLVMQRNTYLAREAMDAAKDAMLLAETPEAKDVATEAAVKALAAELTEARRALARQGVLRRLVSEYDEPAQYRADLEIQTSNLRMADIERQLEGLRSRIPDPSQRQLEAMEALNQTLRGL